MLIVDAIVALKWFKRERDSEAALALIAAELLAAPELVLAEVTNACWKATRLGLLDMAQAENAIESLPRYFVTLYSLSSLAAAAFHIARSLDHPVYDCVYLALAERESVALVTADRRLLGPVAGTRWAGTVQALG
jgi:predicted nucleic acid-binding protein